MTDNQIKKEQEKSVLNVYKLLEEEIEFLKEEHISIQDSDSKWSWLTKELAEKYFISVLLPFYIIKPSLTFEELFQLGFKAFISKLKRLKIHFSDIRNKYLKFSKERLIKYLNENFSLEKVDKKFENAKLRLENLSETISPISISRNRDKLKLCLDLGFSPIKCRECDIGINLLTAIEIHHPTESKEIILSDLYRRSKDEYKLILEKFKNDKVELLCSNHHLEKQLFYPTTFGDIVFKKDLFSLSAEVIDVFINDYLSTFVKSEKYREFINEKYISKNKRTLENITTTWKFKIKTWIKKRFVFGELFAGKCLICGDSNLTHLVLHHRNSELKDSIDLWQSIAHLDCDEIMHIIIKEKCVCLCSNCHSLITYKYHISVKEILKGLLPQKEIDKISEEVTLKHNEAIEKISNFKYDLENISFKCPLKLVDAWKIDLMTIYYYLEIKEKKLFFGNEILYDLELTPSFISFSIKKLIDMDFVQKSDSLIKYFLTEKGINKSVNLIQEFKETANKIKEKIKKYLNNKERYEFLNYSWSRDDKRFMKRKHIKQEENMFKYCTIIDDLISTKGINEFTTRELQEKIRRLSNARYIRYIVFSILIPFKFIEEISNPTSYRRKQGFVVEKVFKLTKKGFDIVANGLDAL